MAQAGKTFRVFVSSTFTDMQEERNALQKKVFPALKSICNKHGYQFQAIDLRWGVGEEAGLDQRTMRICLDELQRCQRTSPRPNFILLMGERYGWRPLPEVIPADEFTQISKLMPAEEKRLFDNWYKEDKNAKPPVYDLQPRSGEFADFKVWEKVEQKIRSSLLEAVQKINLGADRVDKYIASATEQEIIKGALDVEDAREHVFCFFRKIEGLPKDKSSKDYSDLIDDEKADDKAERLLKNVKERLAEKLSAENIYHYQAKWTNDQMSTEHIGKLCDDVNNSLERVILSEIEKIDKKTSLDKEIDAHNDFAKERAKNFIGRTVILDRISSYIAGSSPHPLCIYGEGGSGKSALAAFALGKTHIDYDKAEVISRFIGATVNSSDGRFLLEDLCRQIAQCYGQESSIPSSYEDLVEEFPKHLALATANQPLIIFLDSLDQLTSAHNARSLTWLPEKLPEHVRLVLTTRPGEYLLAIRHKLPEENILKLGEMTLEEGKNILDCWLKEAGRTLRDFQEKEVLDKFLKCGWPLYLKLAFEEARLWKSYTDKVDLSEGKEGIIEKNLFKRLEKEHGEMLVSRTLGYIAATRDKIGLAEDELLEILSADSEFFQDFEKKAKHIPPEPKLPVVIWTRLYFDLEPYLFEKNHENTTLLSFFHRELGEVAKSVYLAENEVSYQRVMAEYFLEKADSAALCDKEETERTWQGSPRALSELPYHLARAKDWDRLFDTLVDFIFLEQKAARVGVQENKNTQGEMIVSYTGAQALSEDYDLALSTDWGE